MLDSRFRHLWRLSRNFGASRLIVVEIDDREVHEWFKRQEAEQRSDEFNPSSHEAEVPEVEPASKVLPGTKSEDVGLPDLVTLDQAAGMVHRTKRALEHYKSKGELPEPTVEGGGGRAHLYDWRTLRPWLESTFGIKLPETFPASRRG